MRKAICLVACAAASLMAQGLYKVSGVGNSQGLLQPGSSAGKVKTISSSAGDAGVGPGKITENTNLHTGQPYYSIPLGSITARTVSYPIVLTYSGNTKSTVDQDNERAPTSWVGLGFNLSTPFVATNHKGTYTSSDDVLFCNLGPYGGGQILLDSAGTRYYVSSNPYIKVAYDTASSGEYAGQFTKWVFTLPDGKKMLFGQDTNAQRYVQYTNGLVKASLNPNVAAKKFVYRWDLRTLYDTIPNRPPKNILTFEYDRILDSAATGKPYVREGYIKKIKWMEGSQEVESYEFKTAAKGSNEYAPYFSAEPKDDQRLFETRRLDTLKCYKEGTLAHFYKFDWTAQKKGLLSRIKPFHPHPITNAPVQDSGWTFTYDPGRFFLLSTLTSPSSRKDSLEYFRNYFFATDGEQDASDHVMLREDNTTEIPLPSDMASLATWKTEATCDERFCYLVVWDKDTEYLAGDPVAAGQATRQKMYVEIRRNLGNYFDTRTMDGSDLVTARFEVMYPGVSADKLKFIPTGNYVLLVNEKVGTLSVYEYDGVRWSQHYPFQGDSRYDGELFGGGIKVFAAPNYFIVQKTVSPSELIVAIRKPDKWTSLNRNSTACDFHNKGSYGDSIRPTAGACMQWDRSSLMIIARSNFFAVADSASGVLLVYSMTKDISKFQDISAKLTPVSGLQSAGYPMNWATPIINISGNSENLMVQSHLGDYSLHNFHYDGDTLRLNFSKTSPAARPYQVFYSGDYFLLLDGFYNTLYFYVAKVVTGNIYFDSHPVRYIADYSLVPLIRTHPNAFSVELYANDSALGLRPKWETTGSNYQSYLYHVHRSYASGFKEKTADLKLSNLNLFNISFSGSDNMLGATDARHSTDSRCSETLDVGPCTVKHYTARFHPDDTSRFINTDGADRISITGNSSWKSMKESQSVMSSAARLGTWLTLDTTGTQKRIRYRHFQYDGKGFAAPDSQFVVDRIISFSTLSNLDRDRVTRQFYYTPFSLAISEFNSNLLMPQFEVADVARVKTDFTPLGSERSFFHVDAKAAPLSGKSGALVGTEKYSRTMAANGDTTLYMKSVSIPYRSPSWPTPLYLPRLKNTYSQHAAGNLSRMTDTTYFLNYCDTNGAPHFVLRNNGKEKNILTQTWFDTLGFAKQTATYRFASKPSTAALEALNPTTPYSYISMIGGSKARYEGYYLKEDSLWRESDQTLTDADIRAGTTPTFRLDEGWLPGTKITERDTANYFQVLESKTIKNKLQGALGEQHTSIFYEGRRSAPVAVVQNARLSNCAILMGENGNASLGGGALDFRNKWESPGTTFSSSQAHTGRYSLRVVNNFGPTINIHLKDVRQAGFGYRISAWIYSNSDTLNLAVERRRYNGTHVNTYFGAPISGSSTTKNVWQRWEVNLTNLQLTDYSFFDGNNDYLRVWIGTKNAAGQGSGTIYVDDIVCIPSNASFALSTFDRNGLTTSTTDALHRTLFYDIGFKGQVSAVRDEKSRIFTLGAGHRMGEN